MSDWPLKDKTCIVGIGETEYTRWGRISRTEFQLACEAIVKAVADAGLQVSDIDGFVTYTSDRNAPLELAAALGVPRLRFHALWPSGGGGVAAIAHYAAMATYTETANYVVCYRSLCQGQQKRFGVGGGGAIASGKNAFTAPFGMLSPAQTFAPRVRRHMALYGTKPEHMGAISVACYKHAQRNPRAVMYGRPLTMEDYLNSRMIVDPFRLFDCCMENDGAAAVVVTSAERAKDLRQRPVYIMGSALGAGFRQGAGAHNMDDYATANFSSLAVDLWARAGITPQDIDVAQLYENFTGMTLMGIEDFGFCKRGEAGPFVSGGRIEWPDGGLPINTSGGNLAEAYIHGVELINEGVRQLRGTSTCQVEGAELELIAGGPTVQQSCMVLRR